MTAPNRRLVLGALTGFALAGASGFAGVQALERDRPPVHDEDTSAAVTWAGHYLALIRAGAVPPPRVATMIAELGIVLAAATADQDTRPLHELGDGALRELRLPRPVRGTDVEVVLASAFGALRPLDRAAPDGTARYVGGSGRARVGQERSVRAGNDIALAVNDWYLKTMLPGQLQPVPRAQPPGPGSWRSTPPDFDPPLLPYWGSTPTLVVESAQAAAPPPPPDYSAEPGSGYHTLATEVLDTVADLDPEQQAIARHWEDGKGTISPPGHWLRIAVAALQADGTDLATSAHVLLRLGLSQHDAFVSCWWTKYRYDVLRPISYIQDVLGEVDWRSPVPTPCFPEYTSGHATQSAAAAVVLAADLGDREFPDDTNTALPVRTYGSFLAAAEEAAVSRLYGGIHYSNSNEMGLQSGLDIGRAVAALPLLG